MAVLFSFLLLSAAPELKAQANAQKEAKINSASVVTVAPLPEYSTDPCYNVKDRDVSIFCAQWKAADAAKSSADATWWTVYLAGIGFLLTAITMTAAIAAAYFAKKAAYENKRSADAAHDANRPWLDVDLKLHGIGINHDGKGYVLQLEVSPLNAGVSPAADVREHVQCLLYEDFSQDAKHSGLDFTARDVALSRSVASVSAALSEDLDQGPTLFPTRDQPFYTETFIPWNFDEGYPTGLVWLITGLRYSFLDRSGETVKVFLVRSFGFPGHAGFKCLGTDPFSTVDIDPVISVWPRYGHVK